MPLMHLVAGQVVENRPVRSAQGTVLTKAVLRAADKLDVKAKPCSPTILGLSEATVSRMKKGGYVLTGRHKSHSSSASCSSASSGLWTRSSVATRRSRAPGSQTQTLRSKRNRPRKFAPSPASLNVIAYLDARKSLV